MNKGFGNIPSSFGGLGGSGNKNKGSGFVIAVIILILTVFFNLKTLSGSNDADNTQKTSTPKEEQVVKKEKPTDTDVVKKEKPKQTEEEKFSKDSSISIDESSDESESSDSSDSNNVSNLEKEQILLSTNIVTQENLPDYDGSNKAIAINGGFADFDIDEFFGTKPFKSGWVQFTELDSMNRVQVARAFLTPDFYRGSEDRAEESNISQIKPTGWKNKKIDNQYIYNRSHLIGYAFSKDNVDVPQNLMTGTRDFNANTTWGMLKYEDMVRDSIKQGESIMYEVRPIFIGNELVARGVQIRATSYGSDALDFNVFIYNVQDNLTINYLDGTSTKK